MFAAMVIAGAPLSVTLGIINYYETIDGRDIVCCLHYFCVWHP